MQKNTVIRIVSALVMIALVGIIFYAGPIAFALLIFFTVVILNDEFLTNFQKISRKNLRYYSAQALLIVLLAGTVLLGPRFNSMNNFLPVIGVIINMAMGIYLFSDKSFLTYSEKP